MRTLSTLLLCLCSFSLLKAQDSTPRALLEEKDGIRIEYQLDFLKTIEKKNGKVFWQYKLTSYTTNTSGLKLTSAKQFDPENTSSTVNKAIGFISKVQVQNTGTVWTAVATAMGTKNESTRRFEFPAGKTITRTKTFKVAEWQVPDVKHTFGNYIGAGAPTSTETVRIPKTGPLILGKWSDGSSEIEIKMDKGGISYENLGTKVLWFKNGPNKYIREYTINGEATTASLELMEGDSDILIYIGPDGLMLVLTRVTD